MHRFKQFGRNLSENNLAVFIILLIGGLAAYWPALNGDFLWDDGYLVGENPFFKSPVFVIEVFRHYLYLDSLSSYYRPVQNISYMLDYWVWAQAPFGYHLSNICYHVLTGSLLFVLLKKLIPGLLSPSDWRLPQGSDVTGNNGMLAFLVSLIWVIHPIHNAAVAYIAGRADSLAAILAMSGWLLYLRAGSAKSLRAKYLLFALAMFLGLLGICAKEIALIWMVLFLFHLFVFDRQKTLSQKFAAVAAIAVIMLSCVALRHFAGGGGPGSGPDPRTFAMRFLLMLRALGDYTTLIFYPADLHMDRIVFTTNAYANLRMWNSAIGFEYLSVLGLVVIVLFGFMACRKFPGQRLRIFALAWFVIGFLPISNLFPLNAQVAEHWIYMPSMGLLLFLGGCLLALPENWRLRVGVLLGVLMLSFMVLEIYRMQTSVENYDLLGNIYLPSLALFIALCLCLLGMQGGWRAATGLTLLACVAFTLRTAYRSYEWADNERFYKQTIAAGGGTTRINLNLALIYYKRGDYVMAEKLLRSIVQRFPDYMPAKINLGVTLRRLGKNEEAEKLLKYDKQTSDTLVKQYAHMWSASGSMADARIAEKKYDEALRIIDEAIARNPDVWELTHYKAKILREMNRIPDAIVVLRDYCDKHWWHYDAAMTLAWLYGADHQLDKAVETYRHAALLDVHAANPYFQIALVDFDANRAEDALKAQRKGLSRDPAQPKQYLFLARILDALHRDAEAQAAFQRAKELLRQGRETREGA